MKRLSGLMDRVDEGLRTLLLGGKMPAWLLGAGTFAAFFLLMMTRTLTQLAGASALARAWAVLMLCLPLGVMICFALRLTREKSTVERLGVLALCAISMLARVSFIERSSGDYDIYLADWIAKLAAGSFSEGMKANIGEYNVLYQYILFIITRLGVPALYAVKAVSFLGDAFLAGAVAKLAGRKNGLPAFGTALLLPTIVLNGGMFAQCDSLYAACALWGLALALENRPARSAVCFGLSLCFKLQSVFILPVVVVLWAARKLRVCDALIFVLTLIAVMLPALLGGKSVGDIIGIYTAQTGLYTGLNYNAANFFGLMETAGLDVYAYGNFAMALAFGACALLVVWGVARAQEMDDGEFVRLALLLVLFVVFLLPRMHERYFYLAVPLSIALAGRRGAKALIAAALIELALLSTYWALAVPLSTASLMMLTATVLTLTVCDK
ncbi:MAG: hypothetical protein IJ418_05625 [Clostridia bacterium]|nr:hypothetical protein [Clostridia bacterium]